MNDYLIGQRVIVNNSIIGVVVVSPTGEKGPFDVWVQLSGKMYATCYADSNVKPLPNGQL